MSFDGSLAELLSKQSGLLPFPNTILLLRKTADILQFLHNQQIIHQDINPQNLLLHIEGNRDDQFEVRLMDVGVSVRPNPPFNRSIPTNSQPLYTAPEQWMGRVVPATDQYALAVLAYQLLTGLSPFQGSSAQLFNAHLNIQPTKPSTFNKFIPPAVDEVLLNALAKRPEDRFSSMSAFIHALESASTDSKTLTGSISQVLVQDHPQDLLPKQEESTPAILLPSFSHPGIVSLNTSDRMPVSSVTEEPSVEMRSITNRAPAPRPRSFITNAPTIITSLSPGRRIVLFTCVALIVVLIGTSIFLFASTHPKVPLAYAAYSGTLAVNDPLRDNTIGFNWPESASGDGSFCQFIHNTYHVGAVKPDTFHYCIAGATDYSDFAFEAHMMIVRGDQGGLIFRADGNNNKFYYFRIGRDGSYGLYQYKDLSGTHAQTLTSGLTPAIHTGLNIDNLIAAVAHGNTMELYINKQYVTKVTNNNYSSGQIGVAAAYATDATEVAFSNVKLWTL